MRGWRGMLIRKQVLVYELFAGVANARIVNRGLSNVVVDVSSHLSSATAEVASITPSMANPGPDPTISSLVASATASASLGVRPYMKPSNKVVEVLAIGDSFTAGIGSNGRPDELGGSGDCLRYKKAWPKQLVTKDGWKDFNRDLPSLTFGACSGATMHNRGGLNNNGLVENQLKQGYEDRNIPYVRIGKPQIAVMTITGNDVGFSDAIKACVYRPYPFNNGDCDATLDSIGNKIGSTAFKSELIVTMTSVIVAGRNAEGSNPPENFQVYIAGYVGFWNHDDPGCDSVSWSWFFWDRQYLTKGLRRRMNDLVDQLNGVIKDVATEFAASGVIYVEGHQGAYTTHRYCEPAPQNYHWSEVGAQTWFWHQDSTRYDEGGEDSTSSPANITQMVFDALIPDKNVQASISKDNPPWKINPAFQNQDSLLQALKQANSSATNSSFGALASIFTQRSFHPKGTAYGPWADAFLASIKANRNPVNDDSINSINYSSSTMASIGDYTFLWPVGAPPPYYNPPSSTLSSSTLPSPSMIPTTSSGDPASLLHNGACPGGQFGGGDCLTTPLRRREASTTEMPSVRTATV